MKIISINLAGRSNFGRNFNERMAQIAHFLDQENAGIVFMQEVTFDKNDVSLADKINSKLKNPYEFCYAKLGERYGFDKCSPNAIKNLEKGFTEHDNDTLTDGMGFLSRLPVSNYETLTMTPVPPDDRGKPDFRVRVTQCGEIDGLRFANVHFSTNNNGWMQLRELLRDDYDFIVGDFNLKPEWLHERESLWVDKYIDSYDFKKYISFPSENATFDHMLLNKKLSFQNITSVEGFSDHNALIIEIK